MSMHPMYYTLHPGRLSWASSRLSGDTRSSEGMNSYPVTPSYTLTADDDEIAECMTEGSDVYGGCGIPLSTLDYLLLGSRNTPDD